MFDINKEIDPTKVTDLSEGAENATGAFSHIVNNLSLHLSASKDVPGVLSEEGVAEREELLKAFAELPQYLKEKLLKDDPKTVAEKLGTSMDSLEMARELILRFGGK